MALPSRLARSAVSTARLRPCLTIRPIVPITASLTSRRHASDSNVPKEPPAKVAQSIIDSLPGSNLVSKTAILSAGASMAVYAISNEYYVVNEESVILVTTLGVFWALFHFAGPMYKDWAKGQIERQRSILNAARDGHVKAVQDRLDSVKQLGSVIDITKSLFQVSKETAQLEAQAYELEQKVALATEAKTTLDSWVRYEGQVKTRQQRELAESVIAKIQKELENPKVLQQILNQSIVDVERIVSSKAQ